MVCSGAGDPGLPVLAAASSFVVVDLARQGLRKFGDQNVREDTVARLKLEDLRRKEKGMGFRI